ncbi:hypothetical protein IC602_09155 [Virgibacillus halodenitrificans]|uniref:Uncharacterized protein n=2 Tax=Virgibacillus halodenitrificans TaxID=1482 RepID=A0ABR7VLI3_VIRHA|nr:hypothetical protein [Virgibacillus halodenitrificans]
MEESEKLQKLKEKMGCITVNLGDEHGVLTEKDKNEIKEILNRESEKLYKRLAGHFHKQENILENIQEEIEDLKIFVKYKIQNNKRRG